MLRAHIQCVCIVSFGCVPYTIESWRGKVKTIPYLPALTSKKVWQMNVKLSAFNGWSQQVACESQQRKNNNNFIMLSTILTSNYAIQHAKS